MAYRYTNVDTRTVYNPVNGKVGGEGKIAKFWLDSDGEVPVDVGLYTDGDTPEAPGASTGGNQLIVQADGMWPAMWDRDGDQDHLYLQVGTVSSPGGLYRIYCDADQRMDALDTRVTDLEPGGAGAAATVVALAAEATTRANADTTLGTAITAEATARATADTAVAAAAATDATTKAAAAQAYAIQRANQTGTQATSTIVGLDATLATKADLVGGVLPSSQVPAIAISDFLGAVASQAAMLALSGQKGDWATRTDTGTTWMITGSDPTLIGSWTQFSTPTDLVLSVNGQVGTVVLGKADVGLANVDNTTDAGKPVSTATATALAARVSVLEAPLTPLRYGAVGDGTTLDDAAFTALRADLPAVGGHIYLPSRYNFRLSQAFALRSGLRIEGGDIRSAKITNTVSDTFTLTGSLQDIHVHDLSVTSGASNGLTGGTIFNFGAPESAEGLSQCTFNNLYLQNNRPDKSIITAGVWLDNRMRDCNINSTNNRSVPTIYLVSTTGSLGDNVFSDIRHTDYGSASASFLWLEEFSTTTALGNTIHRINAERPTGGAITLRGQSGAHLDQIWLWDIAEVTVNHGIFLDKRAGGRGNIGVTIERVSRPGGTLGAGKADIFSAIGNAVGTTVRRCITDGAQALKIDLSFDVHQKVEDCFGAGVSIQSYSPTVTIATGGAAGAGASPTAKTGDWLNGTVTLASGTGPAAGDIIKVTWTNGMRSAPAAVTITPMSATAATAGLYVSSVTATDFTVASANALPASTGGIKFAYSTDRSVNG